MPSIVRNPQTAETPKITRKVSPTRRPDRVLLPQPWSTAISQTTKSRIAPVPSAFINMLVISDDQELDMLRFRFESARVTVLGDCEKAALLLKP